MYSSLKMAARRNMSEKWKKKNKLIENLVIRLVLNLPDIFVMSIKTCLVVKYYLVLLSHMTVKVFVPAHVM
jgi:hypothetical protein